MLALRLALAGRGARAVAERPGRGRRGTFRWPETGAGGLERVPFGRGPGAGGPRGQLAARYRLAGVFLILGDRTRSA